jgi:hypothetical protein
MVFARVLFRACFVLSATYDKMEQQACIEFSVKLDKFATETLQMLREAFRKYSSNRTAVLE